MSQAETIKRRIFLKQQLIEITESEISELERKLQDCNDEDNGSA
jgi:hypothetical protein